MPPGGHWNEAHLSESPAVAHVVRLGYTEVPADTLDRERDSQRDVGAPKRLIEYVVAHELVHLLHADHTREFWATLGRVMPDYEERRTRLRELGPRLVW
jgi:hypothetical protein